MSNQNVGKARAFLYTVNTNKIGEDFKEHSTRGKYNSYVSKRFYGAVIRCRKSLVSLDGARVVMNVRVKARGGEGQSVTGIKIDLMETGDPRIDNYGLNPDALPEVSMEVTSNVLSNIILNPRPTLMTAFFYKKSEGSSFINFVPKN